LNCHKTLSHKIHSTASSNIVISAAKDEAQKQVWPVSALSFDMLCSVKLIWR